MWHQMNYSRVFAHLDCVISIEEDATEESQPLSDVFVIKSYE